ncbi:MFS transporter [bacterium]|nr:MFS transporter [bacterium]
MEKKERFVLKGVTLNVFLLGIVSLLNDVSSEMVYPLLPIFLKSVLKAGTTFIGVIEGIAETTASILQIFAGWLSDRWAVRKPIVVFGYSLSSLARPILSVAKAPWQVLLIRFADRFGKGMRGAPRDAIVADSTPEEFRGRAFGFHRALDNLGAAIGPILATLLLITLKENLRLIFFLASIPALLSLFALIFVRERKPERKEGAPPVQLTLRPFDHRFKLFLIIVIIFTLGNSSDAFLLLRAKDIGISLSLIPMLWFALDMTRTLFSMPAGIISDRVGRRYVIVLGWFLYALTYFGFAFSSQPIHVWLLFIFYGFYYSLTEATERAFIADLVPSELRATAYGIYRFAIGVGAFPASVIFGAIWHWAGHITAFTFGAGLAFLASILLLALIKESRPGDLIQV